MNIHCTCEIVFQDRTALQLYEDHHITRRTMMTVPEHTHLLLEVSTMFRCVRTLGHAVISLTDAFETCTS